MPDDWAQTAADEIIDDLRGRSAFRQAFDSADRGIQEEIRTDWAQIIRSVSATDQPK